MKPRVIFCLGVLMAVAICAGYLACSFQLASLPVAVVQTLVLAESQRTSLTTISGIYADPNFRVVLRALEQRRGIQTLQEPEHMQEHGVMTLGRSFKWSVNRSPLTITNVTPTAGLTAITN